MEEEHFYDAITFNVEIDHEFIKKKNKVFLNFGYNNIIKKRSETRRAGGILKSKNLYKILIK